MTEYHPSTDRPASETRIVSCDEIDDLILQNTKPSTFLSRELATARASAICPELPWGKIFEALEAAGLVGFLGKGTK